MNYILTPSLALSLSLPSLPVVCIYLYIQIMSIYIFVGWSQSHRACGYRGGLLQNEKARDQIPQCCFPLIQYGAV